jgi:phage-related protein
MRWSLVSFDGNAINDGSNFEAFFPIESPVMGQSTMEMVERAGNYPEAAGKRLSSLRFQIHIICKGTYQEQLESLTRWFNSTVLTAKQLIVADLDDSSKQYYMYVTPVSPGIEREAGSPNEYVMTVEAAEPVWLEVVESSGSLGATATGQTLVVTNGGNVDCYPRVTLTPTTAKGGGYMYKIPILCRSRATLGANDFPIEVTDGGWNSAAVVADNLNKCQVNNGAGITAAATTIAYDTVTGTVPAAFTGFVDTEQIAWTGKTGTTSGNLTGCTRGLNGTTAATHADNAVIRMSKAQADGDDVALEVDGVLVPRWLDGMNSAATKVWGVIGWNKPQTLTLKTAISDAGVPTKIQFDVTTANNAALSAMPESGALRLDNERFTYTAKTVTGTEYSVTVGGRATHGTAAAAHAAGISVYWLEHAIWLLYGNRSKATLVQDESKKPIFNLNTSTNTSWVFADFVDVAGLRSGRWNGGYASRLGPLSNIYTADRATFADPASEMGMAIRAYQSMGLWKTEQASLIWLMCNQCGITTVSANGEKRRTSASFPGTAALQRSSDGITWTTVWNEATPASTAWAAWNQAGIALGATYKYLRFYFSGSVAASANNEADFEVEAATLTLDNTKTPSITVGSEMNNYYHEVTITNVTTGESFTWMGASALNEVLTVDAENDIVKLGEEWAFSGLKLNTQRERYLRLVPGNNTIQIDDAGLAGVTLGVAWRDRASQVT